MANELNLLTINGLGTGWIDNTPGPVSSGYQAQNTNIQARTVGQDLTSVKASGSDVIVEISGVIDVDGLPFFPTSEVTLTPGETGVYYIRIISGATATQKSLELTSNTPLWKTAKNALYDGKDRVLNWRIVCAEDGVVTVYKLFPSEDEKIYIENLSVTKALIGGSMILSSEVEEGSLSCPTVADGSIVTAFPSSGIFTFMNFTVSGYCPGGSASISLQLQKYFNGSWITIRGISAEDTYNIGPKTVNYGDPLIISDPSLYRLVWVASLNTGDPVSSRVATFKYEKLV